MSVAQSSHSINNAAVLAVADPGAGSVFAVSTANRWQHGVSHDSESQPEEQVRAVLSRVSREAAQTEALLSVPYSFCSKKAKSERNDRINVAQR